MFLRKSIFGTASMLGLAGMLAFGGCSSDGNQNGDGIENDDHNVKGAIGLALRLADGSDVDTVNYTIKLNGTTVRTGTLAIGADGKATGTITGLDAGPGYTIALDAPRTRPDAGSVESCSGSATFTVVADQTTPVAVVLQCSDTSTGGNITINGTFNLCPKPGIATASPSTQVVGSTIALSATATDKDGDPLTYAWFVGTVYDASTVFATSANATYTCSAPGTFLLNFAAYDGDARGCRSALKTPITVTCTGGAVDAGTPVVDSGTPVVDSGTPVVDSGTPVVDSGTPVVDSGTPVVDSGTPVVDSGTPPPAARWGTVACDTCLKAQCNPYMDYDPLVENCKDAACDAAFACFQRNHCAVDVASANKCYCGNVTNDDCLVTGYVANGPCAAAANTAYGSTNTQVVFGLLYSSDNSFGNGAALFRCGAELCTDQCVTATNIPAP
jgi:hypothetical protein